jgi:GTP pyrophosphokinase
MNQLGDRFERGLVLAARLHGDQIRKGSGVPYLSHLLAVASLVLENGGSEDEAIAALLHDAVEDRGGNKVLNQIRAEFGEVVAEIVQGCSDCEGNPKPPWRERKEAHLAHLSTASESVLLVTSADKLHNARCFLADYRALGEDLWPRFRGGKEGTLWYLRSYVELARQRGPVMILDELDRVVSELERLAKLT